MRYRSGKSNGADGCSVSSRSYQNASNRALHLPMRANQGLVPASASLRASKDVSPFCPPVLHPMERAAGGVSRVRRVVMRAQLLARLSVEEHCLSSWQRICRENPSAPCVGRQSLLLGNAHIEQATLRVDTVQQMLALD